MTNNPPTPPITATVDHLVVLASSLAQGVAWCEATLGVTPGPGGEHALFGTHNRLLKIATPAFSQAYLEIIAINPAATPQPAERCRWFDMDDLALQQRVARDGPQLVHWVAAVPDLPGACAQWRALGLERGDVLQASRPTPGGLLSWQISVRPDGQRLLDGCLPTLIAWGDVHPTQSMADSGVTLQSITLRHPQAALLGRALETAGLPLTPTLGPAELSVQLQTPRGLVTLAS